MSAEMDGIDIHGHGVPGRFMEDVRRTRLGGVEVEASDGSYIVTFPGGRPLRPVTGIMLQFRERLGWLDAHGMRQQLIAPWLDVHGQELDARDGGEWVRHLNDAMAEAVDGTGGRLRAHATLHLADGGAAARELDRASRELGMTGCMIPTNLPHGDLTDAGCDAVWEAAQSLGIPIVLHPPTVAPSGCLFGGLDPKFRGLYGRLIDTTITAARLMLAGVFDRFPDLRLVLVHGGGLLPYQTGRLESLFGEGRTDDVRRFHYDTVLMSAPAIRLLVDLVGDGRIMIGSDYAATAAERADHSLIDPLDAIGVDAGTRRRILRENAEALFRMGAPTRS